MHLKNKQKELIQQDEHKERRRGMITMKIFKIEEKRDELGLSEDTEFVRLDERGYVIHIEDDSEYEKLQHYIQIAIEKGIEVYEANSIFRKLEICDSQIVYSSLPVFMFSTNDKDKFDSLDFMIKNIMIANKKVPLDSR